ncbi:hypothetical protein [Riemerella anatipestifer]|uniref:N-acetyltransferase domain-containing protein n=2 Tax=Riemerella anatipestifer TaxID=34085 RepID=A0AAP6HHN1_RIEAN|nr:hypothetical protein [Riemerella anatipestifer]MBT0573046.1 hypothetical protein [Riemerella anatipestifer]MCU7573700.1 hypothetical protein [Riemerella anatipestifer]MCU7594860.1 hypothetical protein [Riemerella anatipestifer]MCW0486127.1 hypothetical protein [Riemerella anatipestifer]MCW0489191.1 hypothetical protein [Riemerella anatipestifer]
MSYIVEVLKHSSLLEDKLKEIIEIKSIRWKYTYEEHFNWIKENIRLNDYHVLVYLDGKLVAYTNFVNVLVQINNEDIPFMGVGNVCTSISGKGYGNLLMEEVRNILINKGWSGILFCKENLIPYYKKFLWRKVDKNDILNKLDTKVNIMIINYLGVIKELNYQDRNF